MDRRNSLAALFATALTACGGGGGAASAPVTTPAPSPDRVKLPAGLSISSNLVYLEQFETGFHSIGMLAQEQINLVTEQSVSASSPAGSNTVNILNTSAFLVGASCTICHSNSKYWTYQITGKTATSLTISPALYFQVERTSKVERTWFNAAHPGKFYMRQLAQRIAAEIPVGFTGKIVCLGDSWFGGDLLNTLEREPAPQRLAIELPSATIINAGVSGNTLPQMMARFDADVAALTPAYVVVNAGTNDSYNPASEVFDPTALDYFVNVAYPELIRKIQGVGAKAIIIGVPALAEQDADVPAFPSGQLNERAKKYRNAFHKYWGIPL